MKIASAADAANLRGERVKFDAVERRLCDILSGSAPLSQVPDTVSLAGGAVFMIWVLCLRGSAGWWAGGLLGSFQQAGTSPSICITPTLPTRSKRRMYCCALLGRVLYFGRSGTPGVGAPRTTTKCCSTTTRARRATGTC